MHGCWRWGWLVSRVWMVSCAVALVVPRTSVGLQAGSFATPLPRTSQLPRVVDVPTTLTAVAASRICRMTLHEDADVEHAVATLTRMLPGAQWDTVQLAPLPSDVPRDARASVVTVAGTDPLVYWRPPLNGAVLLHELVHAWQATLPDSDFAKLIESLHARDAHAGFDQGVVEQATVSVVDGLSLTLAHGPAAALREMAERAAMVDAGRPGALARRGDALIRLMTGREWAEARVALTRGLSARQSTTATQRDWTGWVRVFFLLEAQAYEAQARCVAGHPQLNGR